MQNLRLRQLCVVASTQAGSLLSVALLVLSSHWPDPNQPFMQELKAAIIAIRCFNVETGLIGENVKETGLLPIRMQWWRDAVNSVFRDRPVKHPVIQALAQVPSLLLSTILS